MEILILWLFCGYFLTNQYLERQTSNLQTPLDALILRKKCILRSLSALSDTFDNCCNPLDMVGVGGSSPLGRTNKFKQKRRSLSGVFILISNCF